MAAEIAVEPIAALQLVESAGDIPCYAEPRSKARDRRRLVGLEGLRQQAKQCHRPTLVVGPRRIARHKARQLDGPAVLAANEFDVAESIEHSVVPSSGHGACSVKKLDDGVPSPCNVPLFNGELSGDRFGASPLDQDVGRTIRTYRVGRGADIPDKIFPGFGRHEVDTKGLRV